MDDFEKSYNRVLHFLSFRPRSEKEIKDYLNKKSSYAKASEGQEKKKLEVMINSIIDKLKEHKFINDNDFASWWIDQRTRVKPRAWKVIQYELKQKGIDEETIQSQFTIYNLQFTNEDMAKKLIQRKSFRYRDLPKQEAYQKLARFLASKGFDWGVIKKVLSNIDD